LCLFIYIVYEFLQLDYGLYYYAGSLGGNVLVTGIIEEFSKFIIFFILVKKFIRLKDPIDGVVYAASVAIAFASLENIKYALNYGINVMFTRTFICVAGHITFASIWGLHYSLIHFKMFNKEALKDRFLVFYSLAPAALLHGFNNYLLETEHSAAAYSLLLLSATSVMLVFYYFNERSPYRVYSLYKSRTAEKDLKKAIGYNPDDYLLHYRYAVHSINLKKYTRAAMHIEKCLKIRPGIRRLILLREVCFLLEGEEESRQKLDLYYSKMADRELDQFKSMLRGLIRNSSLCYGLTKHIDNELLKRFKASGKVFLYPVKTVCSK
jgi:tetratricopeptide (TPR) repeat protein